MSAQPTPAPLPAGRTVGRRLASLAVLIVCVVAVIALVPGLGSLRERFANASGEWIAVAAALKLASGWSYVVAFRFIFCRRMTWRLGAEIGFSELGANAILPAGGAGGLALGAWALSRGGMPSRQIAERSVAFFFLTSVPNFLAVILVGIALAAHILPGPHGATLGGIPAAAAAVAVVLAVLAARYADRLLTRLNAKGDPRSRLLEVANALGEGARGAAQLLRRPSPLLVAGLVGYLAFDLGVLWACFRAFGDSPPFAVLAMGYLIGQLGGLLPIPGGVGGVDVGLVGMLVLYGVHPSDATAAVLAYRAIGLVVPTLCALPAFALLRRELRREQTAIATCAPGGEVEILGRGRVALSSLTDAAGVTAPKS